MTRAADSGAGALRSAISHANTHAGPDTIVFAPAMSGRTILPSSVLPNLTDPQTTINGDINGDGVAEVTLRGTSLPAGPNGLNTGADQCTLKGLTIVGCPDYAVALSSADSCTIRSCYFGVSLSGNLAPANGYGDLLLSQSNNNTIGATTPSGRNVFAATNNGAWRDESDGNLLVGNYFGVRPDSSAALDTGNGKVGVVIAGGATPSLSNMIGGASPGARNLFGGLGRGLILQSGVQGAVVQGNYFGLAADGSTALPISECDVQLSAPVSGSTIGGATAGAGNVFAGGACGIACYGADAVNNRVPGNLFGSNAAGTARRALINGVWMYASAGAETIAGATPAAASLPWAIWATAPLPTTAATSSGPRTRGTSGTARPIR